MMKKELLAPAGSYESLVAAVQGGADAVYLSGKSFGARKFAANFDMEELKEAVSYCHIRDVKVYVTVNTLIKDSEVEELLSFVGELYSLDVDAVIVQDIGALKVIKKHYPDLDCHGSTQMTLHNVDDVKVAMKLGLSRVVVARELSVSDIQYIIDQTGVEVEAFVHGALCISYSGQCLMSSMIGGRSGNRGRCAQACRKIYKLGRAESMRDSAEIVSEGYLLSPKDLSTAEEFERLVASDIYSYKIEGRMKGPEYTYQVVSTYRRLLDEGLKNNGAIDPKSIEEAMDDLEKVFNRTFTKGLILEDRHSNRMSLDTPSNKGYKIGEVLDYNGKKQQVTIRLEKEISVGDDVQIRRSGRSIGARVEHVFIGGAKEKIGAPGESVRIPFKHKAFIGEEIYKTFDKQLNQEIHQWLDKERLKISVNMLIELKEAVPAKLTVTDNHGQEIAVSGEKLVEKAMKVALSEDRLKEQLSKMGDTPFELGQLIVKMDEGVTVPIKEINNIRRRAIEELTCLRSTINKGRKSDKIEIAVNKSKMSSPVDEVSLVCSVATLEQLHAVIHAGVKEVYYKDLGTASEALEICEEAGVWFGYHGNRILHDKDLIKVDNWLKEHDASDALLGHVGAILKVKDRGIAGDFSLNVMNHETLSFYDEAGLKSIHLSPELTADELNNIGDAAIDKEFLLFGRQSVMMMNYCPVKVCNQCTDVSNCVLKNHSLIDEKAVSFPLFGTDCKHVQVLNGPYVNLLDELSRLKKVGINKLRIEFYNEERSFVNGVLSMVNKAINEDLSFKEDEEWLKTTYNIEYTNGHFKRGVE